MVSYWQLFSLLFCMGIASASHSDACPHYSCSISRQTSEFFQANTEEACRSSQTAWYIAWVIGPVHKSVIMHRLPFIIIIIIVKVSELGAIGAGHTPFSLHVTL